MATEKGEYHVGETPDYNGDGHSPVQLNEHNVGKEGARAEAVDIYGNAEEVEHYGYVTRG